MTFCVEEICTLEQPSKIYFVLTKNSWFGQNFKNSRNFFSVEVQGESRDAEIELRQQNGHLAFALNQSKEENARIVAHVNDLNAEILDLRGQIAELNAAHEEERAGLEEAEFQRRLAVRLGMNLGYLC